jgi:hypothetical protein
MGARLEADHCSLSPASIDLRGIPVPVKTKRPSYLQHRRSSAPTYFLDAGAFSLLPTRPQRPFRPRLASAPLTGNISPLWNIEEELSSESDDETLLTPTSVHDDGFLLTPRPAKRINVTTFRPQLKRPRWQRPLLLMVFCIVLFGSLCTITATHALMRERQLRAKFIAAEIPHELETVKHSTAPVRRYLLTDSEQLAVLANVSARLTSLTSVYHLHRCQRLSL